MSKQLLSLIITTSTDLPLLPTVFAQSPAQAPVSQSPLPAAQALVAQSPLPAVKALVASSIVPPLAPSGPPNITFDTKYFYEVASNEVTCQFSFTTPPKPGPDIPYTFGVIGDLGQTADSNQTLEHYMSNPIKGQAVLFAGDLSYADDHPNHDNTKWDTFGRFIEKSVAYQPWIWSAGNHEIDLASNLLPKINRYETPWVIVILHAPWYNSNHYHYMEGESMRVQFEPWFVQYKVDIVFAGHVHSYERSERISNIKYNITNELSLPVRDINAPVYITIDDSGNMEGIANNFIYPQPNYSAYREASFGHAILDIKNQTHAYYCWQHNQDNEPVVADSAWFFNRFFSYGG
ncbi:Purple acid phosphatase 5 [Camellia lanceoleosa]|uniref:Purple acid phosphatase 5 n=1 Tax=Camellia lanceoleosa TaxID=1840588 RepID=A0ACC0HMN7_9ERIC|nr:Purple acid phosphatase 5 [Camellia lanceoleosa]